MKKVVILQHRLLHYRLKLFEELRSACKAKNIDLYLVHGQPTTREEKKRDVGELNWADKVVNRYVSIGGKDILWQPFPIRHLDADLVILMQENRLVSNYPWLFFRGLLKSKTAYWGHGRNFQTSSPKGLREKWKQLLVGKVDWWFAYTEVTKNILLADGYPEQRITVLDNAIDNNSFKTELESISDDRLSELRLQLGLNQSSMVGLFCGSLYEDKRLDYMIQAADKIREMLPNFILLVIGDGPSVDVIKTASSSRPWLHCLGVQRGPAKAAYFRLAHLIFNPGAVGLHVLDAFCAGVPMVTTVDAKHGPEISYLQHDRNGLVINGDAVKYADSVIALLNNPMRYEQLRLNALADSEHYTLEHMIESFTDGIQRCLVSERKI